MLPPYPTEARLRDQWILARRPAREKVDPQVPHTFLVEDERSASGQVAPVATIFLTNRECPWHCVMCDLWKSTTTEEVSPGAIPKQIRFALKQLPQASQIKLYNGGSFFDPRAIPVSDYPNIAAQLGKFERIIVESHPAFVGANTLRFKELVPGQLEVAMGLETVHPDALEKLNKRMTVKQFAAAAEYLRQHQIALRVFLLVHPPFIPPGEAHDWLARSLKFAFDAGATVVSLIPTRAGNGALEGLALQGLFRPPRLSELEDALDLGLGMGWGRVFADLWDLQKFSACDKCLPARSLRLRRMNHSQTVEGRTSCPICGE